MSRLPVVDFLELGLPPRPYAIIDGELPSEMEWSEISRLDAGVNVLRMPGGSIDLTALQPWAHRIRHLIVASASCRDLRAVASMTELRSLAASGPVDFGVDLHVLPNLQSFSGSTDKFKGALDHPNLQHLFLESRGSSRFKISAPVETIAISYPARPIQLPIFENPALLRRITVDGAGRVDLSELAGLVGLSRIDLSRCRSLVEAQHLLELPALRELWLENCPEIDPVSELLSLSNVRVGVIGRNPFTLAFRRAAERSDAVWQFPPGKKFLPD